MSADACGGGSVAERVLEGPSILRTFRVKQALGYLCVNGHHGWKDVCENYASMHVCW